MTVSDFVLFLLTGRLLTWLLQTNGLSKPIWELHPKLKELSECDLCMGFWVFLAMSVSGKRRVTNEYPGWFGAIAQAAIAAFITHLVRLGWHSKFGVTVI